MITLTAATLLLSTWAAPDPLLVRTGDLSAQSRLAIHRAYQRFVVKIEKRQRFPRTGLLQGASPLLWAAKALDDLIPQCMAANTIQEKEACLFGGWVSKWENDVCAHPKKHTLDGMSPYSGGCPSNQFRCNPTLFGAPAGDPGGFCVPSGAGYRGLSKSCYQKSKSLPPNWLQNVDRDEFYALQKAIFEFCAHTGNFYEDATCNSLRAQIAAIINSDENIKASLPEWTAVLNNMDKLANPNQNTCVVPAEEEGLKPGKVRPRRSNSRSTDETPVARAVSAAEGAGAPRRASASSKEEGASSEEEGEAAEGVAVASADEATQAIADGARPRVVARSIAPTVEPGESESIVVGLEGEPAIALTNDMAPILDALGVELSDEPEDPEDLGEAVEVGVTESLPPNPEEDAGESKDDARVRESSLAEIYAFASDSGFVQSLEDPRIREFYASMHEPEVEGGFTDEELEIQPDTVEVELASPSEEAPPPPPAPPTSKVQQVLNREDERTKLNLAKDRISEAFFSRYPDLVQSPDKEAACYNNDESQKNLYWQTRNFLRLCPNPQWIKTFNTPEGHDNFYRKFKDECTYVTQNNLKGKKGHHRIKIDQETVVNLPWDLTKPTTATPFNKEWAELLEGHCDNYGAAIQELVSFGQGAHDVDRKMAAIDSPARVTGWEETPKGLKKVISGETYEAVPVSGNHYRVTATRRGISVDVSLSENFDNQVREAMIQKTSQISSQEGHLRNQLGGMKTQRAAFNLNTNNNPTPIMNQILSTSPREEYLVQFNLQATGVTAEGMPTFPKGRGGQAPLDPKVLVNLADQYKGEKGIAVSLHACHKAKDQLMEQLGNKRSNLYVHLLLVPCPADKPRKLSKQEQREFFANHSKAWNKDSPLWQSLYRAGSQSTSVELMVLPSTLD